MVSGETARALWGVHPIGTNIVSAYSQLMPQAKTSLPPDSDPSTRCHIVQIVRHVPLPKLEALHEPPPYKPKAFEGQVMEKIVSKTKRDGKVVAAPQDLDTSRQIIMTAEDSGQIFGA
jgi:hypothetical protein